MDKPQHTPQPPQVEDEAVPLHPLLRGNTQVDNLLAAAAKRKEVKEFQIEELEKWKDTVNAMAATPYGRVFLKSMLQFTGHFDPVNTGNAQSMVERALKASFYLRWVRPYLNPDLRSTIE